MTKVTYTYWQHYSRESMQMDSMIAALNQAEYDVDYNTAAPESITTASGKVLDDDEIRRYQGRQKELQQQGTKRERERLMALRSVDDRPITWQEASSIIRRFRWHPAFAKRHDKGVLLARKFGGKEQLIASMTAFRVMTPEQFWQRLRGLDAYRTAEVERNVF